MWHAQDVTADDARRRRGGRSARLHPPVAGPFLRRGRRGAGPCGGRDGRAPAKAAGDAAGALAGFDPARLARAVRRAVLDRRRGRRLHAGGLPRAPRDLGDVRGLEGRPAGRPPAARRLGRRLLRREDPRRRRGAPRRPPRRLLRGRTPTCSCTRPRRSSPRRTTSTCGPATAAPSSASAASRWTSACASRTTVASAGRSRGSAPSQILRATDKAGLMHTAQFRTTRRPARPSATAAPTAATRTWRPSDWGRATYGRCGGTSPPSTWTPARPAAAAACAARSRRSCATRAASRRSRRPLPRLRPVRHRLQRGRHRTRAARLRVARERPGDDARSSNAESRPMAPRRGSAARRSSA